MTTEHVQPLTEQDWANNYMEDHLAVVTPGPANTTLRAEVVARVVRHAGGRKVNIVDAGCAAGSLFKDLYSGLGDHFTYHGMEIIPSLVSKAQKEYGTYPNAPRFSVHDMNTGFGDERDVDIVTAINSAYCLKDFEKGLQDFERILRPKGVLIMVNPWNKDPTSLLKAHLEWLEYDASPVKRAYFDQHREAAERIMAFNKRIGAEAAAERYHFIPEEAQARLLQKHGFDVLHSHSVALDGTAVMMVARKRG